MNPSRKVVAMWPYQPIPLRGPCYDSKFMQTQNSELKQKVTKSVYQIFLWLNTTQPNFVSRNRRKCENISVYIHYLHNPIMQYGLGVLYVKTIQVAYSWDCIMLQ